MRITRTDKEYQEMKAIQDAANEGCRVCPCCKSGLYTSMVYRTQVGILYTYRIDLYTCPNCGAEWESEPYRI